MTKLGFSPSRWLARRTAIGLMSAALGAVGLGATGGCAGQTVLGTGGADGGAGGSTTTSNSSPTNSQTATGGSGGATTTTSTSTSSTSTSTTSSTSTSSTGMGGAGGMGGMGGSGGTWVQPPGTADYPAEMEQNNLTSSANPLAAGTKGFTAAIYPQGDIDVFEFDVVTPDTSVTIKTSDGMNGCPAGAKTYVRVLNANNAVIASSGTPASTTGCANLTPTKTPSLVGLAVGKYHVKIESADVNPIPFYVLDIKLAQPGCGDGIIQIPNAEQCDDNNTTDGDGCSAICKLESGTFRDEVEPNDTQDTGNLLDGYAGAVGRINPIADADWYTFNVTVPGSSVFAEVTDSSTGCPSGMDSKIYLFSPTKVQLVADDDGGVSPCSKILPTKYPAATNLPAGTYAIKVERVGNNSLAPYYVLKLNVTAPFCGDNILQTGEQCDDGNTINGDLCSSTCQFEKTYASETEINDTQALANPLPAGVDGFMGSIMPAGDFDYYSFDVTVPGSSVTIRTSNGLSGCPTGFDSKIALFDPSGTQVAVNDDGGTSPCSLIAPSTHAGATNLMPGTYKTRVERVGGNATQLQYVVTIKVSPPGCGDGLVQAGEQCDDNNTSSNDGCSSTCTTEPPYETEPNGSTALANPLWPATSTWMGAISPVGDRDYYKFVLTAVSSVTLVTHLPNDPLACGFDTVIHLLDGNGTQLTQDDDGGPGSCSQIDPVAYTQAKNMMPGTYYVWVQRYGDTQAIPAYQLDLTIQ